MSYVLILLFSTGAATAEFADRMSCQEAAQAVSVAFSKGSTFLAAICQPAGLPQGGKK